MTRSNQAAAFALTAALLAFTGCHTTVVQPAQPTQTVAVPVPDHHDDHHPPPPPPDHRDDHR